MVEKSVEHREIIFVKCNFCLKEPILKCSYYPEIAELFNLVRLGLIT